MGQEWMSFVNSVFPGAVVVCDKIANSDTDPMDLIDQIERLMKSLA